MLTVAPPLPVWFFHYPYHSSRSNPIQPSSSNTCCHTLKALSTYLHPQDAAHPKDRKITFSWQFIWFSSELSPHLNLVLLHIFPPLILGANVSTAKLKDAGLILADTLRKFLYDLNVDDGLGALGYSKADIPALVKGTLPQVGQIS